MRPVIISDENQLVGLLRGRRLDLGISQQSLDDRIGWPDAYCAKVESPQRTYGRRVAWGISTFLAFWLESLGLALVVMPKAQADALIAASDEAAIIPSQHLAYGNRARERPIQHRRVLTTRFIFPGQGVHVSPSPGQRPTTPA